MKRFLTFVFVVICIVSFLSACSGNSQGIGETGISSDEFSRLSLGMKYDTVNDIVGGKGELISESKNEEEDYIYYISVYRYEGESGGYAELEFTHKVAKGILQLRPNDDSWSVRLSSKTKYDLQ